MFGSRRLAKRSIIGTRVSAPWQDGRYYPGVIQSSRNAQVAGTLYTVKFDDGFAKDVKGIEIIAPGFQSISSISLKKQQKVFITHNGREISGVVITQNKDSDDILIACEDSKGEYFETSRRLDEIRLLKSRKSARLLDQDTDYSKMIDMHSESKKRNVSSIIEVPEKCSLSRRRPHSPDRMEDESCSGSDEEGDGEMEVMDEQMAALVLTSLSCSPVSPHFPISWTEKMVEAASSHSPGQSSGHDSHLSNSLTSSGAHSHSRTPSPPPRFGLSESAPHSQLFSNYIDEGIEMDEGGSAYFTEEVGSAKKRKSSTKTVFQCTWPGCNKVHSTESQIEKHVREAHLGTKDHTSESDASDHEEEFYYQEVELSVESVADTLASMSASTSPPNMAAIAARPTALDHDYQKKEFKPQMISLNSRPDPSPSISIPGVQINRSLSWQPSSSGYFSQSVSPPSKLKTSPTALMSTSFSPKTHTLLGGPARSSPLHHKKTRSDIKKCRKVYGMENRDLWCTQCKWKKACTRFMQDVVH